MRTRWLIRGTPDLPRGLEVELVMDTVAPAVVSSVENAAKEHGIVLERLPADEPDPDSWIDQAEATMLAGEK